MTFQPGFPRTCLSRSPRSMRSRSPVRLKALLQIQQSPSCRTRSGGPVVVAGNGCAHRRYPVIEAIGPMILNLASPLNGDGLGYRVNPRGPRSLGRPCSSPHRPVSQAASIAWARVSCARPMPHSIGPAVSGLIGPRCSVAPSLMVSTAGRGACRGGRGPRWVRKRRRGWTPSARAQRLHGQSLTTVHLALRLLL